MHYTPQTPSNRLFGRPKFLFAVQQLQPQTVLSFF